MVGNHHHEPVPVGSYECATNRDGPFEVKGLGEKVPDDFREVALPQIDDIGRLINNTLFGGAAVVGIDRSQGRMPADNLLPGVDHIVVGRSCGDRDDNGDGIQRPLGNHALYQPQSLLRRRQRHRPEIWWCTGTRQWRQCCGGTFAGATEQRGQRGHRRGGEQVPHRNRRPGLVGDDGHHLSGRQ